MFMKCSLSDKNTQNYSFSIAWIFGIINQIIQKTQSLQTIICSLLQAKHLVIIQEKDDGIKMVLSNRLQQNVGVELYMIQILKQFPLQLGEAVAAAS